MTKLIIKKIKCYEGILIDDPKGSGNTLLNDSLRRRALFKSLMKSIHNPKKNWVELLFSSRINFIHVEDAEWLIEQIREEEIEDIKFGYAFILEKLYDFNNSSINDKIIVLSSSEAVLEEVFSDYLKSVELDSQQAIEKKEQFKKRYEWMIPKNKQELKFEPPKVEFYITFIEKVESGDLDGWWELNYNLAIYYDGNNRTLNEYPYDLTSLPNWNILNDTIKSRVLKIANIFVIQFNPKPYSWIKNGKNYRPIQAGVRGLFLLYKESQLEFDSLNKNTIIKWIDSVLLYRLIDVSNEEHKEFKSLVKAIFDKVPPEFLKSLNNILELEIEQTSYCSDVIKKIELCYNKELANFLIDWIDNPLLKRESYHQIVDYLAEHENTRFRTVLLKKLEDSNERFSLENRNKAGEVLLLQLTKPYWNLIKPILENDLEIGKSLIIYISTRRLDIDASILNRFSENELSEIFIYIVKHFPYEEDPNDDESGAYTPKHAVSQLKSDIVGVFLENGFVSALKNVKDAFPSLSWLPRVMFRAKQKARLLRFNPLNPNELLSFANNRKYRRIESENDLLDLILESLERLNENLCGVTPEVFFLWNKWKVKKEYKFRPKWEDDLSDYVKIHLKKDLNGLGVITNREVEIRRGIGQRSGESTDITLDAIRRQQGKVLDTVTVIIEAKGCWNNELKTAMETQLVDRYYGIYLVGWFLCDKWDGRDYRKRNVSYKSMNRMQNSLKKQASTLSTKNQVNVKSFILNAALP